MNPFILAALVSQAEEIDFKDLPKEIQESLKEDLEATETKAILNINGKIYKCTLPAKQANTDRFFNYHGKEFQTFKEACESNHKITLEIMSKSTQTYKYS